MRREGWARAFAEREGRDSTLFEVARDALQLCSKTACEHWLTRISAIGETTVETVLNRIPELSDSLRTLARLVSCARRRIVDGA